MLEYPTIRGAGTTVQQPGGYRTVSSIWLALLLGAVLQLCAPRAIGQDTTRLAEPFATQPKATLAVRVVDDDLQMPIAGANVSVLAGPQATSIGRFAATRGSGRVEFEVLAGTPLTVNALWITQITSGDQQLRVPPLAAGEAREVTLRLATRFDAEMFVRLIDVETGQPVPDAQVRVLQVLNHFPSIARGTRASPTATSDAEGRFRMLFPSRNGLLARVTAAGYGTTDFRLGRGLTSRDKPLLLRLARPATLTVKVAGAAGGFEAGLDVVATIGMHALKQPAGLGDEASVLMVPQPNVPTWRSKITAQGAVLEDVVSGVAVDLQIRRGAQVLHKTQVTLQPGRPMTYAWTAPAFRVPQPGRIVGQLLDQKDQPIADHELLLLAVGGTRADVKQRYLTERVDPQSRVTRTTADGRFAFDAVQPGSWWVGPVPRGMWVNRSALPIDADPAAIAPLAQRVEVAESQVASATLRCERGLYLRGRMIDSKDAPVANVRVGMAVVMPGSVPQVATLTAADGSFVLGPLDRAGTLQLNAGLPLQEGAGRYFKAGEPDVLLRVSDVSTPAIAPRSARPRGRVIDAASGSPVLAAVDVLSVDADQYLGGLYLVADGSFAEPVSARRKLFVARTATGGYAQQEVDLQPDSEQAVELRIKPGVWLILRYQSGVLPARVSLVSQDQPKNYTGSSDVLYERTRAVIAPGSYVIEFLDAGGNVLLTSQLALTPGEREFLVDLQARTLKPLPGND